MSLPLTASEASSQVASSVSSSDASGLVLFSQIEIWNCKRIVFHFQFVFEIGSTFEFVSRKSKQKTNWICNDNKLLSRWYANQNVPSGWQAQSQSDEKKWIRSADDLVKFGNDFENYLVKLKNIRNASEAFFYTKKRLREKKHFFLTKENGWVVWVRKTFGQN